MMEYDESFDLSLGLTHSLPPTFCSSEYHYHKLFKVTVITTTSHTCGTIVPPTSTPSLDTNSARVTTGILECRNTVYTAAVLLPCSHGASLPLYREMNTKASPGKQDTGHQRTVHSNESIGPVTGILEL